MAASQACGFFFWWRVTSQSHSPSPCCCKSHHSIDNVSPLHWLAQLPVDHSWISGKLSLVNANGSLLWGLWEDTVISVSRCLQGRRSSLPASVERAVWCESMSVFARFSRFCPILNSPNFIDQWITFSRPEPSPAFNSATMHSSKCSSCLVVSRIVATSFSADCRRFGANEYLVRALALGPCPSHPTNHRTSHRVPPLAPNGLAFWTFDIISQSVFVPACLPTSASLLHDLPLVMSDSQTVALNSYRPLCCSGSRRRAWGSFADAYHDSPAPLIKPLWGFVSHMGRHGQAEWRCRWPLEWLLHSQPSDSSSSPMA